MGWDGGLDPGLMPQKRPGRPRTGEGLASPKKWRFLWGGRPGAHWPGRAGGGDQECSGRSPCEELGLLAGSGSLEEVGFASSVPQYLPVAPEPVFTEEKHYSQAGWAVLRGGGWPGNKNTPLPPPRGPRGGIGGRGGLLLAGSGLATDAALTLALHPACAAAPLPALP